MYKENLIPSQDFLNKKLYNAGVYLNLARKIYTGKLLLPVSELFMPALTKTMSVSFTLTTPTLALPIPAFPILTLLIPALLIFAYFMPAPTIPTLTPTVLVLILAIPASATMPV